MFQQYSIIAKGEDIIHIFMVPLPQLLIFSYKFVSYQASNDELVSDRGSEIPYFHRALSFKYQAFLSFYREDAR